MAYKSTCRGQDERNRRKNKINKLLSRSCISPDQNLKVLIMRGPVSVEMSLKEVEENYASKPEWKMIEEGGVLSIPVEEFRMINPPESGRSGKIGFEKKKGKGAGNHIDNYSVAQTIKNIK